MNKISIRNATESQSLRLRMDNLNVDDSWILVDVASARVTICNQRPGELFTGQVHLTRKQFNKMIDWYNRPQKMRTVTK